MVYSVKVSLKSLSFPFSGSWILNKTEFREADWRESRKRYPVWRRHFIITLYFKPFFFLSANLRLSIIVCSSNAEHFAWLAVRVVLIEVCTIGVFNLRSLRLWSCHCSLVHGRLRSSFKNRKDQISFHQKMELMKENFSFSSGTCFYAFNLKKEYS